jgi:hypothetical protein
VDTTVATEVEMVGSGVGTVVAEGLISAWVGLVQPAKSAQSTSPKKADMTRIFCIKSAYLSGYFSFVLG